MNNFLTKPVGSRFFSKITEEENLDLDKLFNDGFESLKNKDFSTAVNNFKIGAEKKHLDSIHAYAVCLYQGLGVEKDVKQASELFLEAASRGNAQSLFYCGRMHATGNGLEKDNQKAANYFKKSADLDSGYACYSYAYLLMGGTESTEDKPTKAETPEERLQRLTDLAYSYLEKGAKLNNPACQGAYGTALYLGQGIKQDMHKGLEFLKKAVEQQDPKALNFYGSLLQQGVTNFEETKDKQTGIIMKLPVVVVKKNEEEAAKLFGIAASKFDSEGCYNYGRCLLNGKGVPKDTRKACVFIKKSAQLGYPEGICDLATFYEKGIEVEKDLKKAAQLYKEAANRGSQTGAVHYGQMCMDGIGTEKNVKEAAKYFSLATHIY